MTNEKRVWILGASDPEMEAIEALLREAGEDIWLAEDGYGKRVNVGNAYRADPARCPDFAPDEKIFVECGFGFNYRASCPPLAVVDHHRPGDPGYGKPAKDFWQASSIGQVYNILHPYPEGGWGIGTLLNVAAADHCLVAAYRGECPGVNPDELMKWRVETRAKFQNRLSAEILADVEAARKKLMTAPEIGIGIRDMCGPVTPELPEAACREGVAYAAVVVEKTGRHKMVLGAASENQVVWFIQEYSQQVGLAEVYGDPARGFAGGYLPA